MQRSKTILIILAIIAIGLLATFWYLFNSSQRQQTNTVLPAPVQDDTPDTSQTDTPADQTTTQPTSFQPQVSEEEKLKNQLSRFVSAFVERYGSYSNQSDFENLEDLMQFMTTSLRQEKEKFIRDMRYANKDNSVYYGITTKVLKTEIKNFEPALGAVSFIVSTQKHEMFGASVNAKVFYQSAQVELKKIGSVWQVNNLIWQ